MLGRKLILGLALSLTVTMAAASFIAGAAEDSRVANAAMKGDKEAVRSLLKQAADVNAAQGDGMTALHWAALNDDRELAQMLLYAGANVRATTRIGGYTPLFMAAKSASSSVLEVLLKAGADSKAKGIDGLTPLMMAAMAGDRTTVRLLIESGVDVNAKEAELGQTAMMFAAAFDRPAVIDELAKHGADLNAASPVKQPAQQVRGNFAQQQPQQPPQAAPQPQTPAAGQAQRGQRGQRGPQPAQPAGQPAQLQGQQAQQPSPQPPQGQQPQQQPPMDQNLRGGGNPRGGLTPLMYAAREGSIEAIKSLVQAGAKVNTVSGDKSTAVLLASINGKFDVAKYLVEQGADLNVESMDGATPLNAVVHTQWSRESFHPQPTIKQEQTSYLELMKLMLDYGANPNAKLAKALWYSSYGYVYEGTSEVGTTPFWRCAQVADVDGMRLLISRGADPTLPNKDGVNAFLAASGAGTHGNDEVNHPAGRLTAVKYLVEELGFDVNAADNGNSARGEAIQARQGNQPPQPAQPPAQPPQQNPFGGMGAGGFTAIHNAASRGDNEMLLYLVSKGAKVDVTTSNGVTPVDMANGPRQRVQPFADTIALLEMLGAKNNHKCVSC